MSGPGPLAYPVGLSVPSSISAEVGKPSVVVHAAMDQGGYNGLFPDTTIPGTEGSPYLFVPESPASHSTWGTAQLLPDIPFFGVIGTLGPDEAVDLYRIEIDAARPGLEVNVRVQQPAGSGGETIWLFDGAGRVLASQSIAGGSQDVSMGVSDLAGVVFLGIGRSGPLATSTSQPTASYQAWFARETESDTTGAPGLPASSTGPAPSFVVVSGPDSVSAASPARDEGQVAVPSGPPTGPRLVAALPLRSAAPSGGVLRVGDPAPPVDPLLAMSGASESPDLAAPPPARRPADVEAGSGHRPGSPTVVTLLSPGGFPLRGTAEAGAWSRRGASWDPTLVAAAEAIARATPPDPTRRNDLENTEASDRVAPLYGIPAAAGAVSIGLLVSRRDLLRRAFNSLRRPGASPGTRRVRGTLGSLPTA